MSAPSSTKEYATFYIRDMLCGLETQHVQELLGPRAVTAIPSGPACVHGLLNLRGQILVSVNLHERLGVPPPPEGAVRNNVLVRGDEQLVALSVGEIGDVVVVAEQLCEAPPATVIEAVRSLLDGVYKLEGCLLHALNLEALLNFEGGD
jgi:purine-binding chemotaxis protein CheW